jgi:hypothetical protein
VTGDSQLRASGTSLSEAVGSGYTTYLPVTLNLVADWLGTNGTTSFYIPITAGTVTNVTLLCVPNTTPGLLTVTLSPPAAVNAVAHWHVNGGTYGNGASASLTPGNYTVTFDTVSGWTTPASQPVTMQPSQSIALSGNYTPPAGQPAIYGVAPPIGSINGGTLLTISGVNFIQPATVLVGGNAATNVSVSGSTQITCTTPPGSSNSTVPIVLQTANGNATNQNGFAYGVSRGNKLDMISSAAGVCYGLAVQGNYAYMGEGRNLIVVDVSTPSSPSRVGKITLPGIIQDIAIFNNYAFVADTEGGLQVVNITTPSTPTIAGFYATTNSLASSVTIYGGRAYVTDAQQNIGLQIFDLSNPFSPVLLSTTSVSGYAEKVLVKASSTGVFACLTTPSYLQIIDVSNPQSPALRGGVSIGGSTFSLAMSGNYIYAATHNINSDLKIIDISNTNAPAIVATAPTILDSVAVTVANGYVYAISDIDGYGFYSFTASGSSLTVAGNLPHVVADPYGSKIVVSGSYAYIASGHAGLQVVSISSLYNPSLVTTFTDSGAVTTPFYVAVMGNTLCCGNASFKVFDISQPASPNLAGQLSIGGDRMVAGNGMAYVQVGK